jgi:dTDP-4-amino-4,6-dideoxygalactose transaminase
MIAAFDATRDYRLHRDAYLAAIDRVLGSGRLILGPETDAFENEFADYVGARFAVGVNSGTDALSLALMALDIGLGDEVIVPAMTAPATAAAIRAVGAVPRFVDILTDTLLLDPRELKRALSRRTRCIMPVHLFGCPAPMDDILNFAQRNRIEIIEDCGQGHGTISGSRHVGTFGRIGCFSFYPTKNLGAYGDGGICVTDDPQLDGLLRRLRSYGFDAERTVQIDGRNSRLDEIQAALLRVKLSVLPEKLARRREIAEIYRRRLSEADAVLTCHLPGHAYHQFVVRVPDRGILLKGLMRHRIGFGVHYPTPLHLMPAYAFLGHMTGDFPVAEEVSEQVVSLPMYPELTDQEVDRVCDVVLQCSRLSYKAS